MVELKSLNTYLQEFITNDRLEVFNKILNNRTRYITVVLEDIFQSQNASAVLRSSECFGIQDVHVIENRNTYNINPEVAMGSTKWINLYRYNSELNNTVSTINKLKENGYRIVATTPHHNDVSLPEFDLAKGKFALMFGTELNGLSEQALEHADEFLKIPMFGFTESFNISVSAAIILYELTQRLHQSNIKWQLSDNDRESICYDWLQKTIKKPDLLIEKYCLTHNINLNEFI